MSSEQMRSAILKAYDGKKKKNKVARMSDQQVIAIYYRLLNTKKLK